MRNLRWLVPAVAFAWSLPAWADAPPAAPPPPASAAPSASAPAVPSAAPPEAATEAPAPSPPPLAIPKRPRRVVVKPRAPRKPEPPPLPAPELRLTVDAPGPDVPWTMRLENTGPLPLQVLADARLLAFDVLAPDAKRAARCELPRELRPREDDDRGLVVPGGRAYVEKLDPRLFCFGARAAASLVAGAKVTPVLVGTHAGAPVVSPIDGVQPVVAAVSSLAGVETTITAPAPTPAARDTSPTARTLTITSTTFEDTGRGADAEVTVTVTNVSPHSVTLLFRPETIAFDVTGPSGVGVTDPSPTVHCSLGRPTSPISEVLTTLAPKQHASLALMLAALCPENAFDQPGLYAAHAKLDTRQASGRPIGVRTFDGEVVADATSRVRVRGRTGPPAPEARPRLAEVAH